MIRLFSLLLFTSIFFMGAPTSSDAKGSVKVGDIIPHDLTLLDQKRKQRNFNNLTGDKGTVLVFVRSVEWCPFCQKQVIELNRNAEKFKKHGYSVVTVSYDSVLSMSKFLTKNKPTITLLSDPRSESIRAFGILNEGPARGTRSYGVPHPGVYIISKDKKVQAKFFKDGFRKRPSTDEILAKIKQLNPPAKPYVPPMTIEGMGQDPIVPGDDVIDVPNETLAPVLPPMEGEGAVSGEVPVMPKVEKAVSGDAVVSPVQPTIEKSMSGDVLSAPAIPAAPAMLKVDEVVNPAILPAN